MLGTRERRCNYVNDEAERVIMLRGCETDGVIILMLIGKQGDGRLKGCNTNG